MSYKRKVNTTTIKVEGEDYEGLEIVVKSLTIKDFRTLLPLVKKAESFDDDHMDLDLLDSLLTEMGEAILSFVISWNMEDDNGPVPVSEIVNEELPLLMAVFGGLTQSMSGVSPELGKDSTSGETFPMLPMQMAD